MFQILWLIVLIAVVWYMVSMRAKAKNGQAVDGLVGSEKVYIWVASFLNPVLTGAVFYYGWKRLLPNKAKQANSISIWAFLIEIVLGVVLFSLGGR